MPELQRGLAQADVLYVRRVSNLGGLVVSNLRSQRCHQHQGVLHIPIHLGAINLDAFDHVLDVSVARVCDQRDGVEEVVNDHRLENVKLEITLRASESDRSSCAMNL